MFGIPDIYWIVINSVVSFLFMFIISKLLGKKQIAQLEFIDYAVGISLGSIAAEWATDVDQPFYHFALSMAIFFVLALLVAVVGRKAPVLKRLFKGKPITLVYEGKIVHEGLVKSKIDVNDLLSMLRENGYFDIGHVKYAVFETSGKLSVLPIGSQRPVVVGDLDETKVQRSSLTNVLVVDGEISYSGLSEIGKDVEWLIKSLDVKNEWEMKNVLLATYDDDKDEWNVHYKQPDKA